MACARHLLVDVFEDNSDHADHRNQERAKKEAAKVVPDCPPVAFKQRKISSRIRVGRKIPRGYRCDQNKLGTGNCECGHPEEAE